MKGLLQDFRQAFRCLRYVQVYLTFFDVNDEAVMTYRKGPVWTREGQLVNNELFHLRTVGEQREERIDDVSALKLSEYQVGLEVRIALDMFDHNQCFVDLLPEMRRRLYTALEELAWIREWLIRHPGIASFRVRQHDGTPDF